MPLIKSPKALMILRRAPGFYDGGERGIMEELKWIPPFSDVVVTVVSSLQGRGWAERRVGGGRVEQGGVEFLAARLLKSAEVLTSRSRKTEASRVNAV